MCWKCYIFFLSQQPWELDLSRFSCWLFLGFPFPVASKMQLQEGYWLCVWIWLSKGTWLWFPPPLLPFTWVYLLASAQVNFASQVFSVYISYCVPFDSVLPGESGLILAFPDILLVTCELLETRIGIMFPPVSSSVHSKYLLKEHPSSKYFLVRKVDRKAADGPGRVCIWTNAEKLHGTCICTLAVQVLQEGWTKIESVLVCVSSKCIFKEYSGCKILFEASVIPHCFRL